MEDCHCGLTGRTILTKYGTMSSNERPATLLNLTVHPRDTWKPLKEWLYSPRQLTQQTENLVFQMAYALIPSTLASLNMVKIPRLGRLLPH